MAMSALSSMIASPLASVSRSIAPSLPAISSAMKVSSGIASAAQAASGALSGTSARAASDSAGLIKDVQQIAASNTQASAAEAEKLRKWQEQQNALAMEYNAEEAAKNRDWQKMMSDTAHQREIRDLQAAGLNPVLSAMGGSGAAVGSGAAASGVTSSGAKGDVDQSASQGLVSLLGTLLQASTTLQAQAMSARSNEAIADKTNAMSELVARLTGGYSLQRTALSGKYQLEAAGISARSAQAIESMREAHDSYIHQNYPSNMYQAVAALVDALSGPGRGFSDFAGSVGSGIEEFFDSLSGLVSSDDQRAYDYWHLSKYEYEKKYGKSSSSSGYGKPSR